MSSELDVIHIVKQLRKLDALTKVLFSKKHQYFIQFVCNDLLGKDVKNEVKEAKIFELKPSKSMIEELQN